MESDQVIQVIDKISAKLGVAAEGLKPFGALLVREYVTTHTIYAIACGVWMVVGIIVVIFGIRTLKSAQKDTGEWDEPGALMLILFSVLITAAIFVGLINNIASALAPHYHIIESLLQAARDPY